MNSDEQITKDWLYRIFPDGEVIHEPDGNIPPDFLIDSNIAVEVTRITQYDRSKTKPESLETKSHSIHSIIMNVIRDFDNFNSKRQYYIKYKFERPISPKKHFHELIKRILLKVIEISQAAEHEHKIGNLIISFSESSIKRSNPFTYGSSMDLNQGGWILNELNNEIINCISTKTKKISYYKSQYPIWWLVLVDRIALGILDRDEINSLLTDINQKKEWDKIILLSPLDDLSHHEI